jgi:hypothetical protein
MGEAGAACSAALLAKRSQASAQVLDELAGAKQAGAIKK